MKFVKDNIVRPDIAYFFSAEQHEFCIGVKQDIVRRISIGRRLQSFQLCLENIGAGRQPTNALLRMILTELEAKKTYLFR